MGNSLPDIGFRQDVWWPDGMDVLDVARPDLDPSDFWALLALYGLRATWYTAARCPCGDPSESSGWRLCPVCKGSGWDFFNAQQVRLLATNMRRRVEYGKRPFIAESGTDFLTVRAEHAPAKMDRIVIEDARIVMSGLFARQSTAADPTEVLRYPIAPMTYSDCDGNEKSVGVVHIRAGKGNRQAPGAALVEGVNFDVTKDGFIDWTRGDYDGTAPAAALEDGTDGGLFSCYAYVRPCYRVDDWPHAVRDTRIQCGEMVDRPQALPVQFKASLEWLVTGENAL